MAETATHCRICPLCEACRGLEIRTDDQKVLSIRGAEQDVFARASSAPRASGSKTRTKTPTA